MLSFPASPTNGTQYTDSNGKVWEFDGAKWEIAVSAGIKEFYGVKISLANPAFLTSTISAVAFDTKDFDTSNFFNTVSPTKITIPRTGYYRVNLIAATGQEGFGASYGIELRQNNTNIAEDVIGSFQTAQYDEVFLLNAGDTIELYAYETEGVGSLIQGTYIEVQLQGYTFAGGIVPGFEFSGVQAKTTTDVTTTSTSTAVSWDDIIFNINANEAGNVYWDNLAATKFTIGTTAYYRLRALIKTGVDGSTDSYILNIKKNGSTVVETISLGANDSAELDGIYQFTAADYLELYVENTENVGTLIGEDTFFELIRLGV